MGVNVRLPLARVVVEGMTDGGHASQGTGADMTSREPPPDGSCSFVQGMPLLAASFLTSRLSNLCL